MSVQRAEANSVDPIVTMTTHIEPWHIAMLLPPRKSDWDRGGGLLCRGFRSLCLGLRFAKHMALRYK